MKVVTNAQSVTITNPEYEFGVQYYGEGGTVLSYWGFAEDPRLSGVIDQFGNVEIDEDYSRSYHSVIGVGKRLRVPEAWETF